MITLPNLRAMDGQMSVRVFIGLTPTDMRCGFDTLAQRVRESLGQDPLSGDLFLSTSPRKGRLKILYWDRDCLAVWYKRLEEGTFRISRPVTSGDSHCRAVVCRNARAKAKNASQAFTPKLGSSSLRLPLSNWEYPGRAILPY